MDNLQSHDSQSSTMYEQVKTKLMNFTQFQSDLIELETLSHYGPGLILFIGEQGSGKSALIETFNNDKSELNIINIDGSLPLESNEILASILQQINAYDSIIDFENCKEALVHAAQKKDVLILVDDSQLISYRNLEMLLRLVSPILSSPKIPLRLMLMGNPQLSEQIHETGLVGKDALIELYQGGLKLEEVTEYLATKLQLNLNEIKESFTEKKIHRLWKTSFGNPGYLLKMLHQDEPIKDAQVENKHHFWLRSLLTFLGLGFLWLAFFGGDWLDEEIPKTVNIPIKQMPNNEIKKPQQAINAQQQTNKPIIKKQDNNNPENRHSEPALVKQNFQVLKDGNKESEQQQQSKPMLQPSIKSIQNNKVNSSQEVLPTNKSSAEILRPKTLTKARIKKTTAPIKKEPIKVPLTKKIKSKILTDDENNLLTLDSSHFMIQFVGLSQQSDLEAFVSKHKFPMIPKIYRSLLNGKPWYILVGGNYATKERARTERKQLNSSLLKEKPWIKSVKVIQNQIGSFQKNNRK